MNMIVADSYQFSDSEDTEQSERVVRRFNPETSEESSEESAKTSKLDMIVFDDLDRDFEPVNLLESYQQRKMLKMYASLKEDSRGRGKGDDWYIESSHLEDR